jgi:RNA polymerase sigma factor (sigma-70 family)
MADVTTESGDLFAGSAPAIPDLLLPLLRDGFRRGAEKYAGVPLPFGTFSSRGIALLRARVSRVGLDPGGPALREAASRAALEDLYLAIACDESVPGAWESFLGRFGPLVRSLARRQGANAADADSLADEIGGVLRLPPARGGARTRLGTFDGSGSLTAWLAVVVAHRVSDLRRGGRPASLDALLREDEGRSRDIPAASRDGDPVREAARAEGAARLVDSIRRGLELLTDRERSALSWKYRDGLRQEEIARRLGVGPPRVSRILAAARGKLGVVIGRMPEDEADWESLREALAEGLATSAPRDVPKKGSSPSHD